MTVQRSDREDQLRRSNGEPAELCDALILSSTESPFRFCARSFDAVQRLSIAESTEDRTTSPTFRAASVGRCWATERGLPETFGMDGTQRMYAIVHDLPETVGIGGAVGMCSVQPAGADIEGQLRHHSEDVVRLPIQCKMALWTAFTFMAPRDGKLLPGVR